MSDSAVLLIDCPDRKGLVARVSGLLFEHGANILHADQHQDHDQGLFFMRVEFAPEFSLAGGDSLDETGGPASQSAPNDTGLEEFREHLGGELSITLLSEIGRGVEIHEMNPRAIAAAVAELRARAGK